MGRIVGIDYGLSRIGIAISDDRKIIASSLKTISAEKKLEETVIKLLKELENIDIEKIVVGLPLQMNGKHGYLADEVEHFVEALNKMINCPIVTWDERLTSKQADQVLRETKLTRKKRQKSIDVVAATIILQNYLEAITPDDEYDLC